MNYVRCTLLMILCSTVASSSTDVVVQPRILQGIFNIQSVCVDQNDNVYISERGSSRGIRYSSNGIFQVEYAASPDLGAIGVMHKNGDVWMIDGTSRLLRFNNHGDVIQTVTFTRSVANTLLAIDQDIVKPLIHVYVPYDRQILSIDTTTGAILQQHNMTSSVGTILAMSINRNNKLWLLAYQGFRVNPRVFELDTLTGAITTLFDVMNNEMTYMMIAGNSSNNIYFSNGKILYRYDTTGGLQEAISFDSSVTITGVTINPIGTRVYLVDKLQHHVVQADVTTLATQRVFGSVTPYLGFATGVAIDDQYMYVSDGLERRMVHQLNRNTGMEVRTFVAVRRYPILPADVTVDLRSRYVYTASGDIDKYNPDGRYVGNFTNGPQMERPQCVRFGQDGYIYVCDTRNHQILKFNPTTGQLVSTLTHPVLTFPKAVAFDKDMNVYISNQGYNLYPVIKLSPTGALLHVFETDRSIFFALDSPDGLAVDTITGDLYVADSHGRIVHFNSNGMVKQVMVTQRPSLSFIHSMVVDDTDGLLYVADQYHQRVVIIDPNNGTRPIPITPGTPTPSIVPSVSPTVIPPTAVPPTVTPPTLPPVYPNSTAASSGSSPSVTPAAIVGILLGVTFIAITFVVVWYRRKKQQTQQQTETETNQHTFIQLQEAT